MTNSQLDTIEAYLRQQDVSTLCSVLLKLAAHHEHVMDRLNCLQMSSNPGALSAEFTKTLNAWLELPPYDWTRSIRN